MDTAAIDRWMAGYLAAWDSDDPADVAALFAEDARYYTTPFSQPHVGVDDIVNWWARNGDSQLEWSFEYDVVAREGSLYVVRGVTTYPEGFGEGDVARIYHNIWLVTLDESGRATEFVEYWMLEDTEEPA